MSILYRLDQQHKRSVIRETITALLIGTTIALVALLIRLPIETYMHYGDIPSFTLLITAVVIATTMGGHIAGLTAIVVCNAVALLIYVYFPNQYNDTAEVNGLFVSTVCMLVAWGTLTWYQTSLHEALEREKTAALEIAHRTKNNLQIVLSLMSMQQSRVKDNPGVKVEFASFASRITALSMVTQTLQSDGYDRMCLSEYLNTFCEHLQNSLAPDGVLIDCDVEPRVVLAKNAVPLALVVNEIITNSIKYAFDEGQIGVISISGRGSGEIYCLSVCDDGKGMGEVSSGLGYDLISRFVRQLRGKLDIDSSDRGTCYKITIPSR